MVSNDGLVNHYYSVPSSILNRCSIQRIMPYHHSTNHFWQQNPGVAVKNLAREFTKLAKSDCQPSRKLRDSPDYFFNTEGHIPQQLMKIFFPCILSIDNTFKLFIAKCHLFIFKDVLKKHERLKHRYWLHVLFPLSFRIIVVQKLYLFSFVSSWKTVH